MMDAWTSSSTTSSRQWPVQTLVPNMFNTSEEDLVKSGFYRTRCFEHLVCCGCGWQSDRGTQMSMNHLNFLHKLSNPQCKMSKYIETDYINYYKNRKSVIETESIMIETFFTWSKPYPKIEEMVKSGFYYTGSEDAVACISCGVVLDDWKPEDVPSEEHRKASPHCEFFQ